MIRYLAPAAAIVVVAIVALLALPYARSHAVRGNAYASGRATPGVSGREPETIERDSTRGIAPWALSVVPECFRQSASFRGDPAFARAHVPRHARPVGAGSRLRVADCTLNVGADSAVLTRADDRFVVPRRARFYVVGSTLVLDQTDGTREEVRVYRLHGSRSPVFAHLRDGVYSYE